MQLKPITPETYDALLALRVRPDQERLVASVVKSLADAYVHDAQFLGGWHDDEPVGYVLLYEYTEGDESRVNVVRLMVDARHQGRGLGRLLLEATARHVTGQMPHVQRLRISTLPDNAVALNLYRTAGFEDHGHEAGEVVLLRPLR